MDYYESGTQGHPEPDIKSDGFHSFDKDKTAVELAECKRILSLIAERGGKMTDEGLSCNGIWCAEQARTILERKA